MSDLLQRSSDCLHFKNNSIINENHSHSILTDHPSNLSIPSRVEKCIQGLKNIPPSWSLIPVKNKKPLGTGWTERDHIKPSEMAEILANGEELTNSEGKPWYCKSYTGFGVRTGEISNGILAVDIDGSSAKPIVEAINGGELPKTVTSTSGKLGSSHSFFQIPENYREPLKEFTRISVTSFADIKAEKGEAVEFRYNGHQSVLPPSRHPETGEYSWINSPETTKVALLPEEICKYLVAYLAAKKAEAVAEREKTLRIEKKDYSISNSSENTLVKFVVDEIYPRLDLIQAFPGFELMGQSGHDLWGSPAYRKSESGKSFSITVKNGYPVYKDFKLDLQGDCIQYRHYLKGGSGYPDGKDYADIVKELTDLVGVEMPKNISKVDKPKLKTEMVDGIEKPIHPDQNPAYVYPTDLRTDFKSPVPVDPQKLSNWVISRTFTPDLTIKNDQVDFKLFPQEDNQINCIETNKGGGKTEGSRENKLQRQIIDNVFSITIVPRRKLVYQEIAEMEKMGMVVANFSKFDKSTTIPENTHLVGCTESLDKIEGYCYKYDLYWDEKTTSDRQLVSGGTVRGADRAKLQETIGNELRACKRTYIMDADLADHDIAMLKKIVPNKKVVAIHFDTIKRPRDFKILDGISYDKNGEIDLKKANQSALLNLLIESDCKPFIVTDTQGSKIEELLNLYSKVGFLINAKISARYPLPDGSYCDGETWKHLFTRVPLALERYGSLIPVDKLNTSWVAEMMQDRTEFILKYQPDFIIGSPAIITGFSVKLQKYFSCIAGIFCGLLRTQGLSQFLFRLRDNDIPTYISIPEKGLFSDKDVYYYEDLGKLCNERMTEIAAEFGDLNIDDIFRDAKKRINVTWHLRSLLEKGLEMFEKTHYRSCLRYALESEGHTVEFVTSIIKPDITATLALIAGAEKTQLAIDIFEANEYVDGLKEAEEKHKKLETIETAMALTKARILDRVTGIKDTSIWSKEFVFACYVLKRDFIKQQENFYFLHNPEMSKKRLETALYNTTTAEFVDGESLVHKDYHVIKALRSLEIPEFIEKLENGLEISKKSPEVLEIVTKARRKDIKTFHLAGLKPDNKTTEQRENLKFIKQLLDLVGVSLKSKGQNNTKDGKYHVYGLDSEKFNHDHRTVTLDCVNIKWNTWEAEKYQTDKPNWQYTKETGQRAPKALIEETATTTTTATTANTATTATAAVAATTATTATAAVAATTATTATAAVAATTATTATAAVAANTATTATAAVAANTSIITEVIEMATDDPKLRAIARDIRDKGSATALAVEGLTAIQWLAIDQIVIELSGG